MRGGVVGGRLAVWLSGGVSVHHLSTTSSRQSTSAASNYFSANAAAPWILVDSCHRGISIVISRHICSHPPGVDMGLLAGSVPVSMVLSGDAGPARPLRMLTMVMNRDAFRPG